MAKCGSFRDTPRNGALSLGVVQEFFPWVLDIPCWLLDIEGSQMENANSDSLRIESAWTS